MKKSVILGILGLAAGAASSYGQGVISLDNYNSHTGSGGPLVTYGAGVPLNGVSGGLGTAGAGLNASWTAGLYFVQGTQSIIDPAGSGTPNAALALGTGTGSTVVFFTTTGVLGEFSSAFNWGNGITPTVGATYTVEMIAYAGSSYAASQYRGHSAPFVITSGSSLQNPPNYTGDFFSAFSVSQVPEPATLTLAGLGGLASLVMLRRKRA